MNLINKKNFLSKKKILVLGELIIDKTYKIMNVGKSLETNTPKYLFLNEQIDMGGAGKVYLSTKKLLGKKVFFITSKFFQSSPIKDKNIYFFNSKKMINIEKNRFWENKKKIIQINKDYKKKYLDKKMFNNFFLKILKKKIKDIQSLIISDYNHGLINREILQKIKDLSKKYSFNIYVDKQFTSEKHFPNYYNKIDYLFVNTLEFNLLKKKYNITGSAISSLSKLKKLINCKNIILKKGKNGSCMLTHENIYFEAKSNLNRKIVNVSGAGDHFLSMFASLKENIPVKKKLEFSNIWAAKNLN